MNTEEILFFETDNSCAYCGIRQRENLSKHHIDEDNKNNVYDNQIVLCHNCHHRITNKKGISPKKIKEIKKVLIHKTLTQYGINALKIAYKKGVIIASPFILYHLVDMGYLKQTDIHAWTDEVDYLATFKLTNKGRKLYQDWFLKR